MRLLCVKGATGSVHQYCASDTYSRGVSPPERNFTPCHLREIHTEAKAENWHRIPASKWQCEWGLWYIHQWSSSQGTSAGGMSWSCSRSQSWAPSLDENVKLKCYAVFFNIWTHFKNDIYTFVVYIDFKLPKLLILHYIRLTYSRLTWSDFISALSEKQSLLGH